MSFTKAYEATLRQFHSFVVRPVFSLAMKACPYRADFYAKLGSDQERVHEQLSAWLQGLEAIVAQIKLFFEYVCFVTWDALLTRPRSQEGQLGQRLLSASLST